MKTVPASNDETTSDEISPSTMELTMRKRAREIIAQVFPGVTPSFKLIEDVTNEIIITDEDGLLEEEIEQETKNLVEAQAWAKLAYSDDSPEATMSAYKVLHGVTDDERWFELNERLDELETLVKKLKK